ncbi:ATP-dependent zinc metalloprotease FtsH [subsurface metagenome]
MAATNRPDVLDPALLRPGRFDRQVVVDIPDIKGREGILKVHSKKVPLSKTVDLWVIARGTPGFSGADLANLVNEAALLAAKNNKRKVGMEEFEFAKDKVLMGPERRSIIISDEEKLVTAFHESGHALLGMLLPNADPVHKMTIIPRGLSLGLTQSLPESDKHNFKKDYILDQITLLMGGRVAEEMKFGKGGITTGAQNDIERATSTVRKMVCEWGMSEKLGPLQYGQKEEPIFIGKEIARHKER